MGRTKETIIIDDTKYLPHEIELAIEDASVLGLTSGFTSKPAVLPLDAASLQKSTAGKQSQSKTKTALEQWKYAAHEKVNKDIVSA